MDLLKPVIGLSEEKFDKLKRHIGQIVTIYIDGFETESGGFITNNQLKEDITLDGLYGFIDKDQKKLAYFCGTTLGSKPESKTFALTTWNQSISKISCGGIELLANDQGYQIKTEDGNCTPETKEGSKNNIYHIYVSIDTGQVNGHNPDTIQEFLKILNNKKPKSLEGYVITLLAPNNYQTKP
jgi:hypothetical protein